MDNLAAKYRPKTLDDVTEQSVIMSMVKNICDSKEITNRNFLFIGPAGCGKTTTARIIANAINDNKGEPIEVDAASNSGVDSIRALIDQMRIMPVGSKYKVFIIDECFTGNTLVHTTSGYVPIEDIKEGTRVYNMTGQATVSHLLKNTVKKSNLIFLRAGDKTIVTTRDHLFFTDDGWVPAKLLKEGDVLYDYQTMQGMRTRFRDSESERYSAVLQQGLQKSSDVSEDDRKTFFQLAENLSDMWRNFLDSEVCRCNNLWRKVRTRMEEATSRSSEISRRTCEALAYIYVSSVRYKYGDSKQRLSKNMFNSVFWKTDIYNEIEPTEEDCNKGMRELWKYISSSLCRSESENLQSSMQDCSDSSKMCRASSGNLQGHVRTNEDKQSGIRSRDSKEDAGNQDEEWHIDPEACYAMWKRTFFEASDSFEECIRRPVGLRISCEDSNQPERQPRTLSYELQTRPCLACIEDRCRGGWERPQYEIATTVRRKEGAEARGVRLVSVESYKSGYNDELFQSYFPDTELCSEEFVTMYDLEIEGHPSYFADDILVHNCHALSPNAWQALLKTLEEQPAKSVVCLCTTNPEKIPDTILSRVQTFQLSKISLEGIDSRLKYIIEQENNKGAGITYDDEAILYIAKLAQGGMRSGISLLDKALSFDKHVTIQNLEKSLGLPNYDDYFDLLNAIAKKDNQKIISIINSVYNSGVNFVKWFDGFFSFITNIVKFIYLKDIQQTMIPGIYQDKISNYGTAHSALCLKLSNKLVKMNQELKTTQYLQELAISYLCTPPSAQKG